VHGGNFLARSSAVKQHGAILGMQMHCNRTRVQRSVIPASRWRVQGNAGGKTRRSCRRDRALTLY
jgi:hypothetical protein